ncbi:hypothetical protein CY34DRAFT_14807 [Suillus luteus UH-Slu-Lm8-n1]|uniref:Uncharacterized protein n=1 Tax=Suillus luteus UH-Slu-Lm8-n1 TaxID=930992 RepID=A0A0D0B4J8_9AGAM|nr:hypothetical protein CY34DRAFT_14807 [Suillus luteus UH-Slu-Lm8-n1]
MPARASAATIVDSWRPRALSHHAQPLARAPEFNIWRLIDEIEDSEDPFLPIFEPVSSVLPETMLTEATDDPDVWQFIGVSEIGDFMDPDLPLCKSLIDAAEDLDFYNYPIMTLLIGSWLNSSRWDALD